MSKSSTLGREAIVIGAGMGGLTAARVLSDFFEHVTILERDDLQANASPRAGVPQGKHLHALLAGGQRALDELFPGFTEDLDRVGAVRLRSGFDVIVERPGFDPFPQRDTGVVTSGLTRPQLEHCVRHRVEAIDNVRFERGARVLSLVSSTEGGAIEGVSCQHDGKTDTLRADFVVDASGTGELTLAALRAAGISAVPETTIGVDIAYSTAVFDIPDDAPTEYMGVMHLPTAPSTSRGGLMFPIEGRRWILSLGGRHDEHPPGDEAGFREYAGTLRTKRIANAIASAKIVGSVERFRFNESRLRHFERLESFPSGLLPIADSICRFNPVFDQGMSVAAQEARALADVLAKIASNGGSIAGVSKPFFQRVAQIVEAPWALAAVPDFIFPRTVGKRPDDFEASLRFGMALTKAMAKHPDVHKLAVEIQHLLQPRSALMAPNVIERIMAEMAG